MYQYTYVCDFSNILGWPVIHNVLPQYFGAQWQVIDWGIKLIV